MEFYEVINKRRIVREWKNEDVYPEALERIIAAGLQAPTHDHQRNWDFIILHIRQEKETALQFAKAWSVTQEENRAVSAMGTVPQQMYAYAMPRQYAMLVDCPYVIIPLFKCSRLNAEWVSKLNPLSTAWCVAENIMLATVNEGLGYSLRIPLNREHDVVLNALGVPQGWMTPCFIGIGYPKEDEPVLEQYDSSPDGHIHMGGWEA